MASPKNNPLSAPAYCTRSCSSKARIDLSTNMQDDQQLSAPTSYLSIPSRRPMATDNVHPPPAFHGRTDEDVIDFFRYVERYATYKQMTTEERLAFVAILLRGAASDFYDTLQPRDRDTWADLKASFMARFGHSYAVQWRDVVNLFTLHQQPTETADDFISRVTGHAKHLPELDETIVRYALLNGLKPEIRSYVLQLSPTSLSELLQAARIGDTASSSHPSMTSLLSELHQSNQLHEQHQATLDSLTARLNKLSVSSVESPDYNQPRSGSPSPRRVRFNDQRGRPPSTPYNSRQPYYRDFSPPRPRRYQQPSATTCTRCGRDHSSSRCPAMHARCLNCDQTGHFRIMCRRGRRTSNQSLI